MAFKNIEELARGIAASGQSWSEGDKQLAQQNLDYGNNLYNLKSSWQDATRRGDTAGAQAIHDQTEDFRKRYGGYTGGADGSQTIRDSTYFVPSDKYGSTLDDLAQQLVNYGKYKNPYQGKLDDIAGQLGSYSPFENPYKQQTDQVLNQYLNRGPFSYDLESDPNWQQYQKTYLREGQRAREDTLGNYAAATGGQSSTAAINAASQAQDYYNAQLADKAPELYQFAYERWLNEGDQYANQLNALRGLGADALSAWDANRGLLNDQLSGIQGLSDTAYNRELAKWQADYGVGRDALTDTRYTDETAYNRQQDALDREDAKRKQALAQALEWMQLGLTPDSSVLDAAGLSSGDVSRYVSAVQAQLAAKGGSGGSSGRRSSSSGGSSEGSGSSGSGGPDYDGLFADAYASGHPENYIASHYKDYGFSKSTGLSTEYKRLYDDDFSDLYAETKDMVDKSEYSSSAARQYLEAQGVSDQTIDLILAQVYGRK